MHTFTPKRNNQVKVVPGGNRYFYHNKLRLTTITAACDSKHAMFTVCLSTPVYFRFLWSTPVHLISKLLNKFNWMPFFGFNFLILPTRKFYFRAIYNLVFRLFRQTCFCWPMTLEIPNPILKKRHTWIRLTYWVGKGGSRWSVAHGREFNMHVNLLL